MQVLSFPTTEPRKSRRCSSPRMWIICAKLEDNGNGMESRNRTADTQRMKFVLMAGVVRHDLLDEVNEQCRVSLRWMLTAGASD